MQPICFSSSGPGFFMILVISVSNGSTVANSRFTDERDYFENTVQEERN